MIEDDESDEDDGTLLLDDDEQEAYNEPMKEALFSSIDARRRIERRLELKRLRELLGDPDLDDSFD